MEKNKLIGIWTLVIVLLSMGIVLADSQCSDGIDNDLDGKIDYPEDDGCDSVDGNDENKILGYADGCLVKGDVLKDVFGEIKYSCETTRCHVCVLMTEAGNYTSLFSKCSGLPKCGFSGGGGNPGNPDEDPPIINIESPVQDDVYQSRKIIIKGSSDENADWYYLDNVNGKRKWKRICRLTQNCEKKISLKEGKNNVTIKAMDSSDNKAFEEVSFFVDSKKPKIRRTNPRRGFADGEFYVEIQEENPKELWLNYGNLLTGYREEPINLNLENGDCELIKGRSSKYGCIVDVDLDSYDGQEIEYWFNLTDIAGNKVESKKIKLDVDITDPKINNDNEEPCKPDSFWCQGEGRYEKYIYFNIEIIEENFKEVGYSYWDGKKNREKRLCSRLKNGICEKKKSFRKGHHDLTIYVKDKAGNDIGEGIRFVV